MSKCNYNSGYPPTHGTSDDLANRVTVSRNCVSLWMPLFNIEHKKSRIGILPLPAAEPGAQDRSRVQRERFAVSRNLEVVIVAKADHVIASALGNGPSDGIEMVYSKTFARTLQLADFSVQMKIGVAGVLSGYAEQIRIVIAEYEVNVAGKPLGPFVNDERRAEIAAADHLVAMLHGGERNIKFPEIVMDIR
jgi:hypothetical protein